MLYLYVTQIPSRTTESQVVEHFEKYGKISSISLAKGKGEWKKLNAKIELDSKLSYKTLHGKAHILNGERVNVEQFLTGQQLDRKKQEQANRRISLFKIKGPMSDAEIIEALEAHGTVESHHFIKYREKKDKKYGFVTFEQKESAAYWISEGKVIIKDLEISIKPYSGPQKKEKKPKAKKQKKAKKKRKNNKKKENKPKRLQAEALQAQFTQIAQTFMAAAMNLQAEPTMFDPSFDWPRITQGKDFINIAWNTENMNNMGNFNNAGMTGNRQKPKEMQADQPKVQNTQNQRINEDPQAKIQNLKIGQTQQKSISSLILEKSLKVKANHRGFNVRLNRRAAF